MTSRWALPALGVLLAVLVWTIPLQHGIYADGVITDVPLYQHAYDEISSGAVPYADFHLEYPPLAAGVFWLAGVVPGQYESAFGILMLAFLCATVVGVIELARAIGLDRRRQAIAGALVALSPLMIGDIAETRFDMALAALVVWTLWAAATERWRLAWGLLAAATLVKLVPLALAPVLVIWQRHRVGTRPALRGLAGSLATVAVVMLPFVIMSASGTWEMVRYHLDRPLQVESTGAAYLMVLHALADVPLTIDTSYGSQGLEGGGPRAIAILLTAALVMVIVAIAWTFWLGLHRARTPGDARLMVAASAATVVALLVCGKVLSPQFMLWLLPVGFVVAGRYGPAAAAVAASSMVLTLSYFPTRYWGLVALHNGPIALLVVRDSALIALLACAWPRPSIVGRPLGRVLGREYGDPPRAEQAVSGRYLTD